MKRFLLTTLGVLLSLILILLLLVAWLGLTTSGARWLGGLLQRVEPRLAFEVAGGSLAYGVQLRTLRWQDSGLDLNAQGAELGWSLNCLAVRTVCLDLVRLEGARLAISDVTADEDDQAAGAESATAEVAASEPATKLELPMPVRLELLQGVNLQVETPTLRASLASLQASGDVASGELNIRWGRLQGLRVELLDDGKEAPPRSENPFPLPSVALPLDLRLDGLLLEDADIVSGDSSWHIDMVALNADLRGSELALRKLQLQMPEIQAEASGQIQLREAYPLSLKLRATIPHAELPEPVEINGSVAGDLKQLAAKAEVEGALRLSAGGSIAPLDPSLPFQLDARWNALAWPLQGTPQVSVRDGLLTAQGSLDGYKINLLATVGGAELPEGRWTLQAKGDRNSLEIGQLQGDVLKGQLDASGKLDWRKGLRWQAKVQAKDIDPGSVAADYPGRLSGAAQGEGVVDEKGRYRLQVSSSGIRGRLRGYPVAARGRVDRTFAGLWRLHDVEVSSGPNRATVSGQVDGKLDLAGSFDLPKLAALLPDLQGAAAGRFQLSGKPEEPDLQIDVTGRDIRTEGLSAATLTLQGEVLRLGYGDSRLRFGGTEVQVQEQALGRVGGSLIGTRKQHELTVSADGGRFGGQVRLGGSLTERFDWRGELREAELALPPEQRWRLLQAVALDWRNGPQRLRVAPHCWQQQEARFCLSDEAVIGRRGEVLAELEGFRFAWLKPWWPEGVDWQGPLDARAAVRWQPGATAKVSLRAASRDGQVQLTQEDQDQPLSLDYRRIEASLDMDEAGLALGLALDSDAIGSGSMNVRTNALGRPRPLEGEVALRGLRLEVLKPFLPDIQTLAGVVEVQGRLTGTLEDPRMTGSVRLDGGRVAAGGMPVALTNIALAADIEGSHARLRGSFMSGDGTAAVEGTARWSGADWDLDIGLTGDRLRVIYPPLARLQVSPDLRIQVAPQRVGVQGVVRIPRGEITLEELPEDAVAVSDDVVIVRTPQGAPSAEDEAPLQGWAITTDVEIILGDRVEISGQGLSGELAGNLRVRQRPNGAPEAMGELRIEEGRYRAYGQDLTIRRGLLLFSGPLSQPTLNVEAVRTVQNVVAGIRVEGRPDSPQATLFSEPSMSQEDILSYIIRGRPMRESGPGATQQQLLAQAALSLGIFGGKNLAGSLASNLGIEDFELGTGGEGEATQFEMSGYLSPNLFVRYGIGVFTPVNTLTLRYRLSPRFYVEAVSGLESALDLFYEFRF